MIISGAEFNIGLCSNLYENYYREIYKPNRNYIMLEEIIHKGVKNNICFYNENRTILESEVENIVKIYDTYFKPNFLKINELPLKPDEEYLTYDHYQLLYDIPEEDLFYIRLKGM